MKFYRFWSTLLAMCVIYCVKMKRLFLLCFIVCLGFSAGVLNGVSSAPDAVELIPPWVDVPWEEAGQGQGGKHDVTVIFSSFTCNRNLDFFCLKEKSRPASYSSPFSDVKVSDSVSAVERLSAVA